MMAPWLALFSKDILQIRKVFFWLAAFSILVSWVQVRIVTTSGMLLSYLSLNSFYAMPVMVVIAFILGQHLVTKEYYGHTQRFVEALPIRRLHMASVKFLVGLVVLLILAFGIWTYYLQLAQSSEPISGRFTAIMAVRLSVYVFTLWCIMFTFSLLGRLRIPLMAVSYFIVTAIDTYSTFDLARFGPMSLVESDLFSSERFTFPLMQILQSLVFSGVIMTLCAWFIQVQDGSMVEKLSVPMSNKEKTFMLVLIILASGVYMTFNKEVDEVPFTMSGQNVLSKDRVKISYLNPRYESQATTLATEFSLRTTALEELIPISSDEFAIQIYLSPGLEATEFDVELTSNKYGLLTMANFSDENEWSFDAFGAYFTHLILTTQTNGRVVLEPNHWLVDGLSLWWTRYYAANIVPDDQPLDVDPYLVQALYAQQILPLNDQMLREWEITTDTLGDNLAMAYAYSGWMALRAEAGHDTALRLISMEYQRPVHNDVRDWWADLLQAPRQRFETASQLAWEDFMQSWQDYLLDLRSQPAYQRALAKLPEVEVSIRAEVSDNGVSELIFDLQLDHPFPPETTCTALHTALPPYSIPVGRVALSERLITWDNIAQEVSKQFIIRGFYGSGARIYAAIECDFKDFATPLRIGYSRLTML